MSIEYFDWLKNHPEKRNKLYEQGRNFEYAVMKKLKRHGFYCIRKFGSKGFEDVVAVKGGLVLFIQCKHSRWHDTTPERSIKQEDRKGLIDLARRHMATAAFAGVKNHRMYFMIFNGRVWVNWKPS